MRKKSPSMTPGGPPPLVEVYRTLRDRFGHRAWWPGETPIEIMVGAILTQNTAWKNVEKAIANLKREKALSVAALRTLPLDRLAQLIRSSGYFNQKAIKLKALVGFIDEKYAGSIARMHRAPTDRLRRELLEIRGVGPETADSILLYALEKPVFVVDAYTRRIFTRHHYFETPPTYDQVRERFEAELPRDLDLYNDFHAQIVAVGHHFCKPTPRCEGCPLEHLPHRTD